MSEGAEQFTQSQEACLGEGPVRSCRLGNVHYVLLRYHSSAYIHVAERPNAAPPMFTMKREVLSVRTVRRAARVWYGDCGDVSGRCELPPLPFQPLLLDCSLDEPPHVAGAAVPGIIYVHRGAPLGAYFNCARMQQCEQHSQFRASVSFGTCRGNRGQQIGSVEADQSTRAHFFLRNCPAALNPDILLGVFAGRCARGAQFAAVVSLVETDRCCAGVPTFLRTLIEPHGVLRIWNLRGVGFHGRPHPLTPEHCVSGVEVLLYLSVQRPNAFELSQKSAILGT
ncbi:hypothetical protein B0H19DRAFT_1225907 [Mycena capillaripes]|nr:hypothetical protein B0H19DRAFT_1225896 [Mycena capillaripes]KAJ6594956.1 hypothetical protein B0H19DRAFT_1225907 [Mycena capillaripes]